MCSFADLMARSGAMLATACAAAASAVEAAADTAKLSVNSLARGIRQRGCCRRLCSCSRHRRQTQTPQHPHGTCCCTCRCADSSSASTSADGPGPSQLTGSEATLYLSSTAAGLGASSCGSCMRHHGAAWHLLAAAGHQQQGMASTVQAAVSAGHPWVASSP